MPVIPEYDAKQPLDTDARGMPRPTFSTAEAGAALFEAQQTKQLGSAIGQVAQHFQAQQEQKAAFSAGVQDDARRQELTGLFSDAQKQMPQDGAGFHDGFMQKADELAEKRFAAMPPDQAARYRERWQAERIGWGNKAAETEAATGKQFTTGKIGELQQGLVGEITNNPTPEIADLAYQRGVERIKEAAFLSPVEKAQMLKGWEQSARTAEAQARFANNPELARKALGVADPATQSVRASEGAAMSFFQSKGWTKAQAAGIVGNLIQESSLRTGAQNAGDGADGSDSIGIAQWNAERATALKAYAASKGKPPTDLQTQLEFVDQELRTTHSGAGEKLRAAMTPAAAAAAIVTDYEKPAGSDKGAASADGWTNRLGHARRLATGNEGGVQMASNSMASDARPEGAGDPRYDAIPFADKQRLVRTAEQGFNKQKASVTQLMKDDEQSIMETGAPIDTLTPQRVEAAHGPAVAQTFIQNRQQAVAFHDETKDWDQAPAGHIEESLQRLTPTPGQPGYASQSAYLDVAKKKAAAILKARETDPAASVEKFPEVQAAMKAVKPQDPTTIQALVKARTVAQTALGLTPSPITNKEAGELGSVLTNALPGTEKRVLDKLIPYLDKAYGADADKVLKLAMDQAGVKAATQETAAALFRKVHRNEPVTPTDAQELQGAQTTDAMGEAAGVTAKDMAKTTAANPLGVEAGTTVAQAAQGIIKQSVDDPKAAPLAVPDEAIVTLLRNPSKAAQFDDTFKLPPGTAAKLIKKHEAMNGAK